MYFKSTPKFNLTVCLNFTFPKKIDIADTTNRYYYDIDEKKTNTPSNGI